MNRLVLWSDRRIRASGLLCLVTISALALPCAWGDTLPLSQRRSAQNSLVAVLPAPAGYTRILVPKGSYSEWVRYLPVKPKDSIVHSWKGRELWVPFLYVWRIIDLPLYFNEDLEQCADWALRLWFDYQLESGAGDRLWLIDYNGKKKTWGERKKASPNSSPKQFLRWAMSVANSHSQKKGLFAVPSERELLPGDLLVQNETGGIGHASIIFDVAENASGHRVYLIGFGFMPAQEAHIEKAPENRGEGGWFSIDGYRRYLKGRFSFGTPVLRSFERRVTPASPIMERPI